MSDVFVPSIPNNRITEKVTGEINSLNNLVSGAKSQLYAKLGSNFGYGFTPEQAIQFEKDGLTEQLIKLNNSIDSLLKEKKLLEDENVESLTIGQRLEKQLIAMKTELQAAISEDLRSFQLKDGLEIALTTMVDSMMEALKPLTELPEMPKIPIINSLVAVINTLSTIGRIYSEAEDAAKKTGDPEQIAKFDQDKQIEAGAEGEKNWLERNFGTIGSVLTELGELIWDIIKMIPEYLQCFLYLCIKELLELLKPVFDAFGLVAGTFLSLITRVGDLFFNQSAFIAWAMRVMWKIIMKKIGLIAGLIEYLNCPKLALNEQIFILQKEAIQVENSIQYSDIVLKEYFSEKARDMVKEIKDAAEKAQNQRSEMNNESSEEDAAEKERLDDHIKRIKEQYEKYELNFKKAQEIKRDFVKHSKSRMELDTKQKAESNGISGSEVNEYAKKYKFESLDTTTIDNTISLAKWGTPS